MAQKPRQNRSVSIVPLDTDPTNRILPWIITVMTFLAVLALSGFLLMAQMTQDWQRDLGNRITVQLPAPDTDADLDRVQLTVDALESTPGVASATLLTPAELESLIDPWLGQLAVTDALPVPQLIDVELSTRSPVDLEALEVRVRQIVPAATIDQHRVWVADVLETLSLLQILALAICLLVATAATAAIIATTRSSMAVHAPIIDILHTIGAHDRYIARQFQNHAAWLGLRGGVTGFVVASGCLLALNWHMSGQSAALMPSFELSTHQWVGLLLIPAVAVVLSAITARITVLRTLAQRP